MLMDIQIDASTAVPSVRLNMAPINQSDSSNSSNINGALFTVEDESLTKVLRHCDSIPILVRWLLKRSLAWSEEQLQQHQQQTKSQVHSMRRTSSYADEGGVLKRPRV